MKARPLVLSACATVLVWSAAHVSRAEDDSLYWYGDYKEALAEAKRTQKPIFLEFRCEP